MALIFPFVTSVHILFGFLTLLYLPCQIHARNVGLSFFLIWTTLACFAYAANTIVWRDNVLNSAPVWCDIYTRFQIGTSIAPAGCSLAVVRRLYYTTCSRRLFTTTRQRRWELFIDLWLCIGLPLLVIILAYIVQGHRFDIYEGIGCLPAIYNTPLAYVLIFMWPLLMGVISLIYSGCIVHSLISHRAELRKYLSKKAPALNYTIFCRLYALTLVDALVTVPISIIVIYTNAADGTEPYISWANVHFNFSRVGQFPEVLWQYAFENDKTGAVRFALVWKNMTAPLCAFVFLAIYGTSMEIVWYYEDLVERVVGWYRRKRAPTKVTLPPVKTYPDSERWSQVSFPETPSACYSREMRFVSIIGDADSSAISNRCIPPNSKKFVDSQV